MLHRETIVMIPSLFNRVDTSHAKLVKGMDSPFSNLNNLRAVATVNSPIIVYF